MKLSSPSLALALLFLSACTAQTDHQRYAVEDPGVATFVNSSPVPVYLDGCSPFRFEQRVDGSWIDAGLGPVCVYEVIEGSGDPGGSTQIVPPESFTRSDFSAPDLPGTYRLRFDVGLRCRAEGPLHRARCRTIRPVHTPAFHVAELCDEERECGPRPLAPVYLCPDREHAAGPTGRCLRDPETHVCGWEFRGCPDAGDPLP